MPAPSPPPPGSTSGRETPSTAELRALADKYKTLLRWRQRRDADAPAPERAELRALAELHPGALRELDTLGEQELARRAAAAEAAIKGGACEAWMSWVLALHRLLAAALYLKRAMKRPAKGGEAPDTVSSLKAHAEAIAGVPLSDALMKTLLDPPGGRATPVVLAEVAARFGRPFDEVAETLLPSRRRRV